MGEQEFWKRCNICKKEIGFQQTYYLCSVSTCQRKRTGMVFCSVECFEAHLPMMRHRDAWAEQERSPSREQAALEAAAEAEEQSKQAQGSETEAKTNRRIVGVSGAAASDDLPKDILIVASKLKKYIKARSGMNTSDSVMPVLSELLRELSVSALRHAAEDGRKTVLDRDFIAIIDEFKARPR